MEKELVKKYSNGEVTIVWKPAACIHSKICWNKATGLPEVFNPFIRPWIRPEGASTLQLIDQVNKCPSGALSYFYNKEEAGQPDTAVVNETRIEVLANGPLLVYGNIIVRHPDGSETEKSKVTAFCRCGLSRNKPFCDGTHITGGFEG